MKTVLCLGLAALASLPLRAQTDSPPKPLLPLSSARFLEKARDDLPDISFLTRAQWNAKPPVAPVKHDAIRRITIHHTAVPQKPERSLADKMQGLQAFSQRHDKLSDGRTKPAWPDVPYHFFIDFAGVIAEGLDVAFVPSTNTRYDPTTHITIVLEGSFGLEHPTAAQLKTLRAFVQWLARELKIPVENIQGHKDHAETQCPGKNLYDTLPDLRESVRADSTPAS